MADITKRVQKKLAEYLNNEETVLAALLVEPKGTYGAGMVGHAISTRLTNKVLNDAAAKSGKHEGGIAATMPNKPFVIAKTNKRILVSVSNGISFSEPNELALSNIKLTNVQKKLLGQRLTFSFADKSSIVVDAQRGQPVEAFK